MNTFVNDQKNDQAKNSDRNRSQTDPKANVQHAQHEQQRNATGGDNPNPPSQQPPQNPNPSNPDQNQPSK